MEQVQNLVRERSRVTEEPYNNTHVTWIKWTPEQRDIGIVPL